MGEPAHQHIIVFQDDENQANRETRVRILDEVAPPEREVPDEYACRISLMPMQLPVQDQDGAVTELLPQLTYITTWFEGRRPRLGLRSNTVMVSNDLIMRPSLQTEIRGWVADHLPADQARAYFESQIAASLPVGWTLHGLPTQPRLDEAHPPCYPTRDLTLYYVPPGSAAFPCLIKLMLVTSVLLLTSLILSLFPELYTSFICALEAPQPNDTSAMIQMCFGASREYFSNGTHSNWRPYTVCDAGECRDSQLAVLDEVGRTFVYISFFLSFFFCIEIFIATLPAFIQAPERRSLIIKMLPESSLDESEAPRPSWCDRISQSIAGFFSPEPSSDPQPIDARLVPPPP
jgi:hypothetical protein